MIDLHPVMRTVLTPFVLLMFDATILSQDAPVVEWQHSFGGTLDDTGWAIRGTSDGGFIVVASYESDGSMEDHGGLDFWLLKLTADGSVEWQRMLGGTDDEFPYNVIQTSNGNYVVVGHTLSNNGDVSGNHGYGDGWVVMLDPSGSILWQRCLGGSNTDNARDVLQKNDSSLIVLGHTRSVDGDVTSNHGHDDLWLVELSTSGELIWQRTYGGSSFDQAIALNATITGGWLLTGFTGSADGDVSINHGSDDYWLVTVNQNGDILWERTFGGSGIERPCDAKATPDGGHVVVGLTQSHDGDVNGEHAGLQDGWVVKIDSAGSPQWMKCFGGSSVETIRAVVAMDNGDLVAAGGTSSMDGDVSGNHGGVDMWVMRLDPGGNILGQGCYGGSETDGGQAIIHVADGGYMVVGNSASIDGDASDNHGAFDCWVVRLEPDATFFDEHLTTATLQLWPNPATDELHFEYTLLNTSGVAPGFQGAPPSFAFEVYDALGRCCMRHAQSNAQVVTVGTLAAGSYHIRFTLANGRRFSLPFVHE